MTVVTYRDALNRPHHYWFYYCMSRRGILESCILGDNMK